MTVLSLDFETRGRLDLRKVGLDAYTADPSFQVLMAAYRIDQEPLQHWEVHERPIPAELKDALLDPKVHRWAFNAAFERVVTKRGLGLDTPYEGWRCSMVLAYMRSFTGGLAEVGEQLGVAEQKDKIGKQLISLFCQPQRITKTNKHEWRDWNTDPDRWDQFVEYNKQDVLAEEATRDQLAPFPTLEDEWAFYCLDQIINDRGMPVDLDFVRNVKAMSDRRRDELLQEMKTITGLDNANSVSQLLPWLQARGYPYDDIRKESVQKALNRVDELWGGTEAPIVSVLQRRLWAARTSTKKADAALLTVGEGNRIRHMYKFAGASRTQRFSGALVQPQNLARTPKQFEDAELLDCATNVIRCGDYDALSLFVDEPMMVLSGCMRGMFRGEFQVCDYSSIESVGLAWIARCERMLDVFRAKRDIYKDFGSQIYKKPYEEITSSERQVSKSGILGCGFRLGAGKVVDGKKTGLLGYAESMGVELTQEEAEKVVKTFRDTYAEVKQFWYDCEEAIQYVIRKRRPYNVGYLRFDMMPPFLIIRLPSGRHLYYYMPRLERRVVKTDRVRRVYEKGHFVGEENETYERVVMTYMGRNQKKNKWERLDAHGGIITENCIGQGTLVLTDTGWVPIESVQSDHLVWDGVEFVRHDGVVCRGRQSVISVGGVWITPDHKVLTNGGFVEAAKLDTSPPSSGFDGSAVWSAYGNRVRGWGWPKILVAIAMRLRRGEVSPRNGFEKGRCEYLRVLREGREAYTRYVRYANLCGLAFDVRSMSVADSSCLPQLRWARDYSLPGVGGFRELFSRYGWFISSWFDDRKDRQQQRVLPRELRMGYSQETGSQYPTECNNRYTSGSNVGVRSGRDQWNRPNNITVSTATRVAGRPDVRNATLCKSALVYDIVNVGFRHRFTVKGSAQPFIVSNCVQSLCRDILKVGMQRVHADGFNIVGHAHDEIIAISRKGDNYYNWQRMRELMTQPIEWAPGFPLGANGWKGEYYRK